MSFGHVLLPQQWKSYATLIPKAEQKERRQISFINIHGKEKSEFKSTLKRLITLIKVGLILEMLGVFHKVQYTTQSQSYKQRKLYDPI